MQIRPITTRSVTILNYLYLIGVQSVSVILLFNGLTSKSYINILEGKLRFTCRKALSCGLILQ